MRAVRQCFYVYFIVQFIWNAKVSHTLALYETLILLLFWIMSAYLTKTTKKICCNLFFTYLDLKKTNLFGQDRKRIMISMVNQALQTHSTKKNASWALVWYLSNVQAVELKEVRTVIFLITGTRISGWVLRQKETIDTTIKNTEMIPITWNVLRKKIILALSTQNRYLLSIYVAKVSRHMCWINLYDLYSVTSFSASVGSQNGSYLDQSNLGSDLECNLGSYLFDHAS